MFFTIQVSKKSRSKDSTWHFRTLKFGDSFNRRNASIFELQFFLVQKFPVGRSDCRWCVGKVGGDSTKFRFAPWWKLQLEMFQRFFWGDGKLWSMNIGARRLDINITTLRIEQISQHYLNKLFLKDTMGMFMGNMLVGGLFAACINVNQWSLKLSFKTWLCIRIRVCVLFLYLYLDIYTCIYI